MRLKLEAQSPADRKSKSQIIQTKLFGLEAFRKAARVCFYDALPTEVDTRPMIDQARAMGKRVVVLPAHDHDPAGHEAGDCVVVPGLVFDRSGNRLGRGKGFYDRFLGKLGSRVFKVGLAFSFQVVPAVPVESYDVRLDAVLTDS